MTERAKQNDESSFDIDAYLQPLLSLDPSDSIRIAEFLAIELTVLRKGIEKVHADVAELRACIDRIQSPHSQS